MLQKLKTINYQKYLNEFRDIRFVGLLVFASIVLLVTWSGISVIQTNYELQKKISSLKQSINIQELENSNLKLKNLYFESDQYLELQARRQFGKAAAGEVLIIVPRTVSLAHSVAPLSQVESSKSKKVQSSKPSYQSNFEAWANFLFRQQSIQ